jgi:hypothetical protein
MQGKFCALCLLTSPVNGKSIQKYNLIFVQNVNRQEMSMGNLHENQKKKLCKMSIDRMS